MADNILQALLNGANPNYPSQNGTGIDAGQLFKSILGSLDGTARADTISKDTANVEAEHQRLMQQANPNINPVTNMHNDQIDALRSLLSKVDKAHAEDFFLTAGHDNARMMVDQHDALMQNMADNQPSGKSSSGPASQPATSAPVTASAPPIASPMSSGIVQQNPQMNINPLALLHGLVQGMVDIIPTSPEAKLANSQVAMNRIKIAAGLPSETLLPTAQAGLAGVETFTKQAELSAGKPQADVALTKQSTEASKQEIKNKQAEIAANIYKTQSERVVQHIQRLTERRKQINEQMAEDLQHGPILGRGERLKEYKRQLNWYDDQINSTSGISNTGDSSKDKKVSGFISTPGGNKFKRL